VHEIDPGKIPISRPLTIGRVDKKKKIPIIVFKTPRLGQASRSAGYWTRVKSGFPKLKSIRKSTTARQSLSFQG